MLCKLPLMKRLLLIDGSNMMFRAYYAVPAHLSTSSGQPTNAVFGFVSMLNKLLSRKQPDYGVVVFDPPGGSFRLRESADYKANRERMPSELASQIPLIDRVVEAFNFPVLRITDFEADDVIATLAKQAEARGEEVIIVSGDKDFSQLLTENVSMYDGMREITYNPELVRKKFGVAPHLFVDFQALCGDKIDNIPGVPGIGKKTASKLLEEFGSLDNLLANLDQVKGKLGEKIAEHREDALLSRRLAKLDSAVALDLSLDEIRYQSPSRGVLNELFTEFEFFSLLKSGKADEATSNAEQGALSIMESPAEFSARVKSSERWAVHLMAERDFFEFRTVGLALADLDGEEVVYAPFSGDFVAAWKDFFETFGGTLVAHDAKDLFRFFLQHDRSCRADIADTRTASYLVDPGKGMPHDLEKLAKIHLQRVLPKLEDVVGKGKSARLMSEISTEEWANYSASLARAVANLYQTLEPSLQEGDLVELAAREVRLSQVLAGMERAGIHVDRAGLDKLSEEFRRDLAGLEATIFKLAGREFNVGSPKQLAEVLFEDLKLPVIKKTKTGYSTNAEVLEKLAKDHEIARVLLQYRKFEKLITTYVDVLLRELHPVTDRIHTTFGQTVSTTGRLITSEPDLQRTPVRTDEGKRIRRLFRAEPGHLFIVADWSQIELRVLAHLCGDPILVDAFANDLDVHRKTAGELFHKSPEEVSKEERDIAKTVNFATIYGQGASALSQNLGITKKEAEEIIARYFQVYSGVQAWIDETVDQARVSGRVETLAGRTRFIPELFSKNFAVAQAGERMAVNTPVQGSAADICKAVMLSIADRLAAKPTLRSRMLLQIHDELIFECPENEVEEVRVLVTHEMENAWDLRVPLVVSVGVGPSWEDAKE